MSNIRTPVSSVLRLLLVGLLLVVVAPVTTSSGQLVYASGTPKDTAANVTIGSGSVFVGAPNTVTTAVTVNGYSGTAGLGAYDLRVVFDRTKLQITGVQGSDTVSLFSGTPTNNMTMANSTTGILSFSAFHSATPGPTGPNIRVARITWQGNVPGAWPLTLSITALSDTGGNDVTGASSVNGAITVTSAQVPPVATFAYSRNPTSGVVPCSVVFTDTSSGPPASWSWNFGDSTSSIIQNPTKIYSNSGSYSVTLTVSNPLGSSTTSAPISIYAPPAANFNASPVTTNPGKPITFSDTSTGNVNSWSWNFGDGTGSSSQNPAKVYASDGRYTVSLAVANPAGTNTVTRAGYITIVSSSAEVSMTTGSDNNAYVGAIINRFYNLATGETLVFPEGIGAFDAYVSYSASGVNIKKAVGLGSFSSPTVGLNVAGGTRTTVVAFQTGSSPQPAIELFRIYPWVTGSKDITYTLTLRFNTISTVTGNEIVPNTGVGKTFRRGDANGSGTVTVTDALFIAQYLAGLRQLGEASDQVNLINSATVRNDSAAEGSSITITDALVIAQMLALLRDSSYNMI